MPKIITAIVLIAFLLTPAAAQRIPGSRDFRTIAPRDWTLLPAEKSNERRFVSPSGDAWLALYSTPASGSIAGHLESWGVKSDDRVTYQNRGQDWRVVSGYTSEDRIFYRRTALACHGRKWHDLEFEYPRSAKRAMDEFVTRASYALAAYGKIGCETPSE